MRFFWFSPKQPSGPMGNDSMILLGFFAVLGCIGLALLWIGYGCALIDWLFPGQ